MARCTYIFLLSALTLLARVSGQGDAWLAVINNNQAEEPQRPQLSLAELEQRRQQEVRAQQENRRQDSRYDFEPQPQPVNQPLPPQQVQRQAPPQQVQRQPAPQQVQRQVPPPQQVQRQPPPQVQRKPSPQQGQRQPPPQQVQRQPPPPSNRGVPPAPVNQGQAPFPKGPPQRKPLPPRPPPKKKPGLLDGLVEGVTCAATELYAADKLNDQVFIRGQIDCLTKKGPCDDLGRLVRRMAPDILRGGCPPPCDQCKKKQIQKVMATLSRRYPRDFQKLIQQFRG